MKKILALCLCLSVLLLCGCSSANTPVQKMIVAMGTTVNIQLWGGDARATLTPAETLLYEQDITWSHTNPLSIISRINAGEETPDAEQQAVLDRAEELSVLTGGCFDPKMGALAALWKTKLATGQIPTEEEIQAAASQQMWNLSAVSKCQAGAVLVDMLEERYMACAFLNMDDVIQSYGGKNDGSAWSIAIPNPRGNDTAAVLEVEGTMTVSTAGDYQNYKEIDGVRYHHILDPKTGMPVHNGIASVTVLCRDAMKAGALSTALFVKGLEEATEFWRAHHDFEAVFIMEDGTIYATDGVVLTEGEAQTIPSAQ